ncbi:MAG TPA: APC family permease, partial [Bacteroidetes bacterium]|nr:APC family permease [Bacteroidota bacterium]
MKKTYFCNSLQYMGIKPGNDYYAKSIMQKANVVGWKTATAIVVANMVGTGVFTSLGFQLVATQNTWSILLLWALGAIMALCGALSYAELSTHLVRSGGEYHFLSKIYHPYIGYLSGWVSLTVGFAAPVALAAMALAEYSAIYLSIPPQIIALVAVLAIAAFHSVSLQKSSQLQNISTLIKIVLILAIIAAGIWITPDQSALNWNSNWQQEIVLPAFAVSFVYVTFSYSGWNAAAYIADEIQDVRKNLPKALILGTLLVSALYLLLNYVFLKQAPLSALQGELKVGQVAAIQMFGTNGGKLISLAIGLMLVSSISAMAWAGPRVTQVMAEDHRLWRRFAARNTKSIPVAAIWLQTGITCLLVLTGTFEQVLIYSGFILQLFAALAVAAVFLLRKKNKAPKGFRSPL